MGVLTWKGATAKEALGSRAHRCSCPTWAEKQGFAGNADAVAGAKLFAQSGCLNCHTYLGAGNGEPRRAGPQRRWAPKGRAIEFVRSYI